MRELLGPEARRSWTATGDRPSGPSANPLKLDPAALPGLLGIPPDPVPWCPEAWFLPRASGLATLRPCGRALLRAGAVRPWPSGRPRRAAGPAGARPGRRPRRQDHPGRRSPFGDDGVVVANEVERSRVQALADNLDRWGSRRTVLAGETVARLAEARPGRSTGSC